MNPVSIHKYKDNESTSPENKQRYEKNYKFLSKAVDYYMDVLLEMEKIYHNKQKRSTNEEMYNIVKKEKKSFLFFALFPILTVASIFSLFHYNNYYILIPIIIFALLTYGAGSAYFGEENKKLFVLERAYKEYAAKDIISEKELISLQDLISKEKMLELLKSYGNNIPMSEVTIVLWIDFATFRDYVAEQKYHYIEMQKECLK